MIKIILIIWKRWFIPKKETWLPCKLVKNHHWKSGCMRNSSLYDVHACKSWLNPRRYGSWKETTEWKNVLKILIKLSYLHFITALESRQIESYRITDVLNFDLRVKSTKYSRCLRQLKVLLRIDKVTPVVVGHNVKFSKLQVVWHQ